MSILNLAMDASNYNNYNFDEGVVLNSVRNRKKVSDNINCPICSCTIRSGELESHLAVEIDRLNKLSTGSKRKSGSNNTAIPGSSSDYPETSNEDLDLTGCTGAEVYKKVCQNRRQRLRSLKRPSSPQQGECPVCNVMLPISALQKHALRCLKMTGAIMEEDLDSSEEGSIDVENDEPQNGGTFGAEYEWCGQSRIRATALQPPNRLSSLSRRVSTDQALVVDGDEDAELYGPPQYSPTRMEQDALQENGVSRCDSSPDRLQEQVSQVEARLSPEKEENKLGLVEASVETRIQALRMRIKELEARQNAGNESKCLICLGPYTSAAVSIQCWHVYCEVCWLESLKAKKICPQCNTITTVQHLRRIYM